MKLELVIMATLVIDVLCARLHVSCMCGVVAELHI